jgi:hypothetical protein
MKYTKTELKNMIDASIEKDVKAKEAEGVSENVEEFRITNISAHIRVIADLLCRMQDQIELCNKYFKDSDVNIYEQAWRGMIDDMEWDLEFWDRRLDEIINGSK